jgi:ubiquitin C-terminal hydrolase
VTIYVEAKEKKDNNLEELLPRDEFQFLNYTCITCKKITKTKDSIKTVKLPSILVIGIRRATGATGATGDTNYDENVTIPDQLDLASIFPYDGQEPAIYELQSVILFTGKHNNGHYMAAFPNPMKDSKNKWTVYDDINVYGTNADFRKNFNLLTYRRHH